MVNGLTEIWQGEAQTAFQAKFDGMKSTFTQFEQILEEYALNLSDVVQRHYRRSRSSCYSKILVAKNYINSLRQHDFIIVLP